MNLEQYYKCSYFNNDKKVNSVFVVPQDELILQDNSGNRLKFKSRSVVYACKWIKEENFNSKLPAILIPIRNNSELIKHTLDNLERNNIFSKSNVIVIDDRSEENIEEICKKYHVSYLRIDNDKGFNFSMLNNIAAKICNDEKIETIICWNSDLWCVNEQYFDELLKRHYQENSKISGAKLLYPPIEISLNKEIDSENIKKTFPNALNGAWRNTVQFGGDYWINTNNSPIKVSPIHYKRFCKVDNPLVNCDRPAIFVTGALQIWNLKHFISLGGFNPSLSKNFQDVDICLRSIESNVYPVYFGKDLYFYHDESLNMHSLKNEAKMDSQMISDHYLYSTLWNEKILRIVM